MPRGSQGRLVKFAREIAAGREPREAAIAAGYPPGSCFDGNARKRAGHPDVKRMVAELKAPIAEEMEITLKWAIAEHRELYRTPRRRDKLRMLVKVSRSLRYCLAFALSAASVANLANSSA